jgi:hypothetical protein
MLCDKLKEMRELKALPQRKIASALDIDTATYCKIEKGVMRPKREYLSVLADIFEADESKLLKQWLAERIVSIAREEEEIAQEALKIACKILLNKDKSDTLLDV